MYRHWKADSNKNFDYPIPSLHQKLLASGLFKSLNMPSTVTDLRISFMKSDLYKPANKFCCFLNLLIFWHNLQNPFEQCVFYLLCLFKIKAQHFPLSFLFLCFERLTYFLLSKIIIVIFAGSTKSVILIDWLSWLSSSIWIGSLK